MKAMTPTGLSYFVAVPIHGTLVQSLFFVYFMKAQQELGRRRIVAAPVCVDSAAPAAYALDITNAGQGAIFGLHEESLRRSIQ
jgi:hypothetical protein